MPFEALAWAITEQLIETTRAFAIQRRLTYRYGRAKRVRHVPRRPDAAALAARAPSELAALDLAAKRATGDDQGVARGRPRPGRPGPARAGLEAAAAIPNIGSWTIDCLAFHGQGRDDMLPAGDLAYVKLVGRLARLGPPRDRGRGARVLRALREWAGLAGTYMLRAASDRPYLRAA